MTAFLTRTSTRLAPQPARSHLSDELEALFSRLRAATSNPTGSNPASEIVGEMERAAAKTLHAAGGLCSFMLDEAKKQERLIHVSALISHLFRRPEVCTRPRWSRVESSRPPDAQRRHQALLLEQRRPLRAPEPEGRGFTIPSTSAVEALDHREYVPNSS